VRKSINATQYVFYFRYLVEQSLIFCSLCENIIVRGWVRISVTHRIQYSQLYIKRGADKSLAQPGRKQATATEDFDFRVSYL